MNKPYFTAESLQVGDEVGVSTGREYQPPVVRKVTKVTASGQITLDNGTRWSKHGYELGDKSRYMRAQLVAADEARRIAVLVTHRRNREAMVNRLGRVDWRALNDEQLIQVATVLKAAGVAEFEQFNPPVQQQDTTSDTTADRKAEADERDAKSERCVTAKTQRSKP